MMHSQSMWWGSVSVMTAAIVLTGINLLLDRDSSAGEGDRSTRVAISSSDRGETKTDAKNDDPGEVVTIEAVSTQSLPIYGSIDTAAIRGRPTSEGGGKMIDFVEAWCEPDDLLVLREMNDVKEVHLHYGMGDAHLEALRGIDTMEILGAGDAGSGRGIAVIATMPQLKSLHGGPMDRKALSYLKNVPKLEELHFSSSVDDPKAYESLEKLARLRHLWITLEGEVRDELLLSILRRVPELRSLHLSIDRGEVTDRGIAAIWKHEELRYLWLKIGNKCNKLTPDAFDGIRRLSDLRELRIVQLPDTIEEPRTIKHISHVPSLEVLLVPWINNESLAFLNRLKILRILWIDQETITPGLDPSVLRGLKNLEILDLNGDDDAGSIPTEWIPELVQFPNLKRLDLESQPWRGDRGLARVTDRDLEEYVSKLTELEVLLLCHQPISDEGVYALRRLDRLRRIDFSGTDVTDAGERRFFEWKREHRADERRR